MYKAIGNNYLGMTEAYIFRGDRGIDNQARSKDFSGWKKWTENSKQSPTMEA